MLNLSAITLPLKLLWSAMIIRRGYDLHVITHSSDEQSNRWSTDVLDIRNKRWFLFFLLEDVEFGLLLDRNEDREFPSQCFCPFVFPFCPCPESSFFFLRYIFFILYYLTFSNVYFTFTTSVFWRTLRLSRIFWLLCFIPLLLLYLLS